jgi:hypothetical protein
MIAVGRGCVLTVVYNVHVAHINLDGSRERMIILSNQGSLTRGEPNGRSAT